MSDVHNNNLLLELLLHYHNYVDCHCKARYMLATKLNSTRSTLLKVDKVDRVALHTGNNINRIGNNVDRIGNNINRIGNNVDRIGDSRPCCPFRQQSTFNKVDRVEFNFVASVQPGLK